VKMFKNSLMQNEVDKVSSLANTLDVITEEISLINTVGMLTQSLIRRKLPFKESLLSEEFKTISAEVNMFLSRLLNVSQVCIWFEGYDMFNRYYFTPNFLPQCFQSEEIAKYLREIGHNQFLDGLNFIDRADNVVFTDLVRNMQSLRVDSLQDKM